jgi:malate synthase
MASADAGRPVRPGPVRCFHNAAALAAKDRGPYFYLPKLQSMEEAALWNAVLGDIETMLGLPHGQMKVTVLIETLPARSRWTRSCTRCKDRIVGLNCGRWDYIFSYLKTLRRHRDRVLPERGQVTMVQPFLKRLLGTADEDLPPPRRACDGRHGRADPDQRR